MGMLPTRKAIEMRKGYYLFPASALELATVSITDTQSGAVVETWENGIGGIAGNTKPGHIYRVIVTVKAGGAMGFYLAGGNDFSRGYNHFNPNDPANIL
jgi:hypothetical protein